MALTAISPEAWSELRKSSELGVDDVTLSQRFGVTRGSIRIRRLREGWITAEKLESQANAMRDRRVVDAGKKPHVTALEVVASTLGERAESYSLRMFDWASGQADKSMKSNAIQPPSNWKELDTADRMARRAAGLDKQTTAVQVNLGSFFRPASGSDGGGCVVVDETDSHNLENSEGGE